MRINGRLQEKVKETGGNDVMLALWMRLEIKWLATKYRMVEIQVENEE